MKLSFSQLAVTLLSFGGTVVVVAQPDGVADCVLSGVDEDCNLGGLVDCLEGGGAPRTNPNFGDNNFCTSQRYTHCPSIVNCYAGCPLTQVAQESFMECLSAYSIAQTNQLSGLEGTSQALTTDNADGTCNFDCANFDYSNGLTLEELEEASGNGACQELEDQLTASCVLTDESLTVGEFVECVADARKEMGQQQGSQQQQQPTDLSGFCSIVEDNWCPVLGCYNTDKCDQNILKEYYSCIANDMLTQAPEGMNAPDSCDFNCDDSNSGGGGSGDNSSGSNPSAASTGAPQVYSVLSITIAASCLALIQ